jgi:hypothetical protein
VPSLQKLEIAGFRSFGESVCEMVFEGPCAVISGPNSQGKTAIAEAVEFLLTGQTVRRELLGGAKAEFDRCLRNVHIPATAPVWVSAELTDSQGATRVLKRELIADYTAQDDCVSRLFVDGIEVDAFPEIGVPLADPPLRAPVLLQHSLRFALSAKPSERTEYFKSVVEIGDLEVFRDAAVQAGKSLSAPTPGALEQLASCAQVPELASICSELEAADPDSSHISDLLSSALEVALVSTGISDGDIPMSLEERLATLKGVVEGQREQRFPIAAFTVADLPEIPAVPFDASVLHSFIELRTSVDAETDRVRDIFTAVLAVPSIAATESAVDCPVCVTEDALTPGRIAEIRKQLETSSGFGDAKRAVDENLRESRRSLEGIKLTPGDFIPAILRWDNDRWTEVEEAAGSLGVSTSTLGEVRESAKTAAAALDQHNSCAVRAAELVDRLTKNLQDVVPESVSEIEARLTKLSASRDELATHLKTLASTARPMVETVKREIDRTADLLRWADLLNLVENSDALGTALLERHARSAVQKELDEAIKEIDRAKGKLFDARFEAISDEIESWWELLRPEEHVSFGGVKRRGTGRRFVDFKAAMRADLPEEPVERDAIGVFSDSQLNALGLAAFLARCEKQSVPFVVLDEPVQAGDDEHRTTFARFAVKQLMDNGVQVIVSSYDDRLTKLLRDLYRDAPLDSFDLKLSTRTEGTEVTRTTNPVLMAFRMAAPFARHDDETIRREGAQKLRPAAERLAKEIILKGRRANDEECDIDEYDGKMLRELQPLLEPYLPDADERGKWRAISTILNPAHHDDTVPARNALVVALGDLERSLKDHGLQ